MRRFIRDRVYRFLDQWADDRAFRKARADYEALRRCLR